MRFARGQLVIKKKVWWMWYLASHIRMPLESCWLPVVHHCKLIYHKSFTWWCMSELCYAMNQLWPCIRQQTTQTYAYTAHKKCHLQVGPRTFLSVRTVLTNQRSREERPRNSHFCMCFEHTLVSCRVSQFPGSY